jgi:UDP-N-acetylmuramoyl-tripeptide--D-alanyl-D-alanine ligase
VTVELTIEAALEATAGELLHESNSSEFHGLVIDSREVKPRQAFVAVAGDRFDGHDFWRKAADAGAGLLVVQRDLEGEVPAGVAVIRVEDTRQALGHLARAWRREVAPEAVVAVTGSVGKTTTKELTRALLERLGETHCNPGNFNNDIGLPLTLLSMPRTTRYLVTEMGMNAPGEIAYLASLAEPDVGVVTCVAPVHLEGLGSIEAIADAKGELLRGMPDGAWAVVPGDEPLLEPSLAAIPETRRLRFGDGELDDVRVLSADVHRDRTRVRLALRGEEAAFDLPLVGRHNAWNAAAAAGAALVLGLEPRRIAQVLALPPGALAHRSAIARVGTWHVLDDCYNANPVATKVALDTVTRLAADEGAPALAVLGDMLELGTESERYHREVGRHAAAAGLSLLVAVGQLGAAIADGARDAGMPPERVMAVAEPGEAARAVAREAPPGAWVLVKASRGARLEAVISALEEHAKGFSESR